MKVKLLVFAAALLALSSLSFAQPFVACVYDDCFPLTNGPAGAPLADGTVGVVYYDANSNGPDAADAPAVICDLPPDCPSGPPGTYNFNTFLFNAGDMGLDPGCFLWDPCLVSSGILPVPARYYIVVTAPNGGHWTSSVMTFVTGPQDVDLCTGWGWTDPVIQIPLIPPPDSQGNRNWSIDRTGHGSGPLLPALCSCITLTHAYPSVVVCVGPGLAPGHTPNVTVSGNCDCGNGHVASAWNFNGDMNGGAWTFVPDCQTCVTGSYCQTISLPASATEGCVELCLDYILAAQMGNIAILPLDNAVSVKFTTLSETNLARFEVRRDHQVIARLAATNNASGSDYSYVDNSAANGHTYTYELVSIGTDGSSEVVATQAVTPSMEHAVVTEYALHQNFPNPFNPTTSIRFDLVEQNIVTLKIYNANGQVVATLVNGERAKGVNVVNFDATNLTSGLYFYTVKVGNVYNATKKMLLVK